MGFESVWRKRPLDKSGDGCAIAWRNSTFELEATSGFDFGSSRESTRPDRTCAFALLKWRRDPTARVLVATTHLARGPELEEQRFARGYQYGKLFRELLEFAAEHHAENVPVVLTGDLNAQDCDELAGIARSLVRLLSAPTHPLLWSVMDAPTPPTTYTDARSMRIDYVLYQSANLALTGVGRLPPVKEGMPNAMHPSDHLPVSCRLKIRQSWAVVEEDARQWAACIQGGSAVRPLSGEALRAAFSYFDKDGSGRVTLVQLEAGLQTLGFPGLDASRVLDALRTAGETQPASDQVGSGGGGDVGWWTSAHRLGPKWYMSLDHFVEAYTQCMDRQTSASMRQLEIAFKTFDISGDGVVTATELREALRRMSSAPLDEDRLELLIRELDPEGTGNISMEAFTRWMNGAYSGFIKDPTRVVDARAKMVQYSQ
jgi:Ca2+-binding EF-hand superfamily protein/exonuclease III